MTKIRVIEASLQTLIVIACAIIFFTNWNSIPIEAQLNCGGVPTIFANKAANSWPAGTLANPRHLKFLIFDTPAPTERDQLTRGIDEWNPYSNDPVRCANIILDPPTFAPNPYNQEVPPFVMPADNELDAARQAQFCGFLFADHRVTLKVDPLVCRQAKRRTDVFAIHRHLADVVD